MNNNERAQPARFAATDFGPATRFPRAARAIVRVLVVIDDRVLDRKWSPRKTIAFVFGSAAILWGLIIVAGFWIASALSQHPGR